MKSIFVGAFLTALVLTASSQPLQTTKLSGVVRNIVTGEPISRASIELISVGTPVSSFTTLTSASGVFSIENLYPGQYRLVVTRNGFVRAEYGQRNMGATGTVFTLEPGANTGGLQIGMLATGAIQGRLYDMAGRSVVNGRVDALKVQYMNGERSFRLVQRGVTNDLGEYRLFWLPPGQYYLRAMLGSEDDSDLQLVIKPTGLTRSTSSGVSVSQRTIDPAGEEVAVPFYFPNATDPQHAQPINVKPGEDSIAADITVATFRPHRIRGQVVNSLTRRPAPAEIVAGSQSSVGFAPIGKRTSDGAFDISMLPGSYSIYAKTGDLSGRVEIRVSDSDVENVQISLEPSISVRGQVFVDGAKSQRYLQEHTNLTVRLVPTIQLLAAPVAVVGPDGKFLLRNVPSADYRLSIGPIQAPQTEDDNTYLRSARLRDEDLLADSFRIDDEIDVPIEIIIGTNGGKLDGFVVDNHEVPLENVTVVMIPQRSNRQDLYKSTSTDASGYFQFSGIAPAEYRIFAWEQVETDAWRDPEFRRFYEPRATSVEVLEGRDYRVNVKAIPLGF